MATNNVLPGLDEGYISKHIDEAIEKEWLKVYYQPIIRLRTGAISDCEALCRWEDPKHGLLSPGFFIPELEKSGFIHKLDMFMIDRVLKDVRNKKDQGFRTVPVSVNLSRQDFEVDGLDIFDYIEEKVDHYELTRQDLDIEITESTLNSNEKYFRNELKKFHDAGYSLWMDDFGSGYSSFNVLKNYHFDVLKIDMGFLADIEDEETAENTVTILYSIIRMAKRLGMETVCEGTETKARVDMIRDLGCEKTQGFYFSKPVPLDQLVQLDMNWESAFCRGYETEVGMVNVIDAPLISQNKESVRHRPMAVVEYNDNSFSAVQTNASFIKFFQSDNMGAIEGFEDWVNGDSVFAKHFHEAARRCARTYQRQTLDFIMNGEFGTINFDYISGRHDKDVFSVLMIIESMKGRGGLISRSVRQAAVRNIYSIYHFVHLLNPEDDTVSLIFTSNAEYSMAYGETSMSFGVPAFAERYIHPADKERFIRDYSSESLKEFYGHKVRNKVCWYRTSRDGKFIWMMYTVMTFEFLNKWYVLSMARNFSIEDLPEHTDLDADGFYVPTVPKDDPAILLENADELTREFLTGSKKLQEIMDLLDVGIFWKDKNRKFLGTNKYFLDYYGFKSATEVIGKNDEEVGWHIHPDGFKTDEEEVLSSGIRVRGAIGTCLKKGEVRTIMAYKRPLYLNGKIEGLLGYFFDVTDTASRLAEKELKDIGLDFSGEKNYDDLLKLYMDEYERNGTDFTEISVELDGFSEYMRRSGAAEGGKMLFSLIEGMQNLIGVDSTISHVGNGEIRILHQIKNPEESAELLQNVGTGTAAIVQNKMSAIVHSFNYSELDGGERAEIKK